MSSVNSINTIKNDSLFDSFKPFVIKSLNFAVHVIKETGKGLVEGLKLALAVGVIVITAGSLITFFTVACMTIAAIPIPLTTIFLVYQNALIISTLSSVALGGVQGFVTGVSSGF